MTAPANQSLVEAKRLVLMGQIAAGVSHELNNLLGKIIGLAEMTMDDVADRPAACAELETLISVAEQGARLVGRLEACSGWNIAEPDRFDLAALVEAACAAAEAGRPDIRLHREIPVEPYWIVADAALIHVALDAVLENASAWGASRIDVLCRAAEGGGAAELVVRDDGTDMTREALARVFEPFFTTDPAAAAAGVGLSLARAAIAECRGHIEAVPSSEGGTMVRLTLPTGL
jgi:two-component system NtrC family sensor kinase